MCLVCGVNKSHIESIEKLFSEDDGRPIFRKTMILTRFKTLRRMLKFNNLNASNSRLSSNKLVAVCLLLNNLLNNSQSCYLPGQAATVDDQLYPFQGRCRYIQYFLSKTAKCRLKFWSCNRSATAYFWNLPMCTGKDKIRLGRQLGEHVVLTLTESLQSSSFEIILDNLIRSLSLARQLLQRNMTFSGKIRKK